MNILSIFFSSVTLTSALRMATPIVLSGVGGSFSDRSGTFNIALESFMLSAAFFAAYGSYMTQNPYIGLLLAVLVGLLLSMLFGLFVLYLNSDPIVVSIALNTGAWGFTTLLLKTIFNTRGALVSDKIVNFSTIDIPGLRSIPWINSILNKHIILTYLAIAFTIIAWIVMYKTPFGLRLRGIGMNEKAARTAGTQVVKYKWIGLVICGISCGFAGAYFPLCGVGMFSENMTAGRGFLAVAAIMAGNGNPLQVALFCTLFAYADALSSSLQNLGIPSSLVLTFPYLATILVLFVKHLKSAKAGPSLTID